MKLPGWIRMAPVLSERDRRALRLGLFVVLPVLAYVAAVKPYREALQITRDRVRAERELLTRERQLLALREQLPVQLEQARHTVQLAEARLVKAVNSTAAENRVSELLEQMAELSRVLLQEVRSVQLARDEKAPDGMQILRLAIRGESDLEGVITYLHRIEQSPVLLRVHSFTLENGPPPRIEVSRNRNARPVRRGQLGVMKFTVQVDAFAPATTTGDSP